MWTKVALWLVEPGETCAKVPVLGGKNTKLAKKTKQRPEKWWCMCVCVYDSRRYSYVIADALSVSMNSDVSDVLWNRMGSLFLGHRQPNKQINYWCRCGKTWWGGICSLSWMWQNVQSCCSQCGNRKTKSFLSFSCSPQVANIAQMTMERSSHCLARLRWETIEMSKHSAHWSLKLSTSDNRSKPLIFLLSNPPPVLSIPPLPPSQRSDHSWGQKQTLPHITTAMPLLTLTQWVTQSWMEVAVVFCVSCLVLIGNKLCVFTQFTGTEMPCVDFSPSPMSPASGKRSTLMFRWQKRWLGLFKLDVDLTWFITQFNTSLLYQCGLKPWPSGRRLFKVLVL